MGPKEGIVPKALGASRKKSQLGSAHKKYKFVNGQRWARAENFRRGP